MVLDASVTIAWATSEETTSAVTAVFGALVSGQIAWVPSLWWLEVPNVLNVKIRKGQGTILSRNLVLVKLSSLDIRIDKSTAEHAWGLTLNLADKYKLTPYDASYLEVAIRRGLPLATLDGDLRKAATKEGIALLGL